MNSGSPSLLRNPAACGIALTGVILGALAGGIMPRIGAKPAPQPASSVARPVAVPSARSVRAREMIAAIRAAESPEDLVAAVPKTDWKAHPAWRCVPAIPELLALARIGEWPHPDTILSDWAPYRRAKIPSFATGIACTYYSGVSLAAWAERDPEAAFQFATTSQFRPEAVFRGFMTRHHWDMVKEEAFRHPENFAGIPNRQDFRLRDAAGNEQSLRALVGDYPPGKARKLAEAFNGDSRADAIRWLAGIPQPAARLALFRLCDTDNPDTITELLAALPDGNARRACLRRWAIRHPAPEWLNRLTATDRTAALAAIREDLSVSAREHEATMDLAK